MNTLDENELIDRIKATYGKVAEHTTVTEDSTMTTTTVVDLESRRRPRAAFILSAAAVLVVVLAVALVVGTSSNGDPQFARTTKVVDVPIEIGALFNGGDWLSGGLPRGATPSTYRFVIKNSGSATHEVTLSARGTSDVELGSVPVGGSIERTVPLEARFYELTINDRNSAPLGLLVIPEKANPPSEPDGSPIELTSLPTNQFSVSDLRFENVSPGWHDIVLKSEGGPHAPVVENADGLVVAATDGYAELGQTITIRAYLEPGTYTVYCGVPGHADAGETATIVVK